MKTLNKKLFLILFLVVVGISLFSVTNAVGLRDGFASGSSSSVINSFATEAGYGEKKDPEYYIGLLLTSLFSILGIVAVSLIIYSGVVWMTARGNESMVEKAKENLSDLTIGLIIVVGGYALTMFILKIFS